ncbi:MAG: phage tail family protein [Clostridiales bacterium]|nr:phage tail family protein [Clostridiales bacterium]
MIKDIFFTFVCNGMTLLLREPEYGVTAYEGLEATDYEIEKENNVNHIGARMKRKRALSRPISVEFDYLGPEEKKSEKRQELIRFFSPFRSGKLTVNYMGVERQIEYEVSSFTCSSQSIYDPLSCLVELDCMDPAFRDILQSGERISTWIGGWKWKFTLPFKMKERGEPRKNIINEGHVETPIEIEFHGPAVNPKITNQTTGEFIRIKRELTTDDTLYINTAFGQKKVEIIRNGIREDAFDYIDLASSFFSLQVGDNVIEYYSENGLDPQSVEIYYYNRYIGV